MDYGKALQDTLGLKPSSDGVFHVTMGVAPRDTLEQGILLPSVMQTVLVGIISTVFSNQNTGSSKEVRNLV